MVSLTVVVVGDYVVSRSPMVVRSSIASRVHACGPVVVVLAVHLIIVKLDKVTGVTGGELTRAGLVSMAVW